MSRDFDKNEDMKIQNIVGSGTLPVEVKVPALAEGLEDHFSYRHFDSKEGSQEASESEKEGGFTWISGEDQPGLYYEVGGEDGPQVTFHESGNYIVRADDEESLRETNERVKSELAEVGLLESANLYDESVEFEIVNVVGLAVLDRDIRLKPLYSALVSKGTAGGDVQYEPEEYPALDYTTPKYPCSFLVYSNGNIIIAGAGSVEEAREAIDDFYDEMYDVYFSVVDMSY